MRPLGAHNRIRDAVIFTTRGDPLKTILTLAVTAVLSTGVVAQEQAPNPPATPTTVPTTNPADLAAVKDALDRYNKAVEDGRVQDMIDSIATTNPTQKKALVLMGRLTTASGELYEATKAKFGTEGMESDGVDKSAFQGAFPLLPLEQLQINISGETAALTTTQGQPLPFTLKKQSDSTWKIDGSFLQLTDQQLADQTKILDAVIEAFNQTAKDVEAGYIRSPDEVLVLMQHRAQKAMRKIQIQQIEEAMKNTATESTTTRPSEVPSDITAPQQ